MRVQVTFTPTPPCSSVIHTLLTVPGFQQRHIFIKMSWVKFPRFPILLSFGVLFCLPLYPFTPHFFEILTKVERLICFFLFFCLFVFFYCCYLFTGSGRVWIRYKDLISRTRETDFQFCISCTGIRLKDRLTAT